MKTCTSSQVPAVLESNHYDPLSPITDHDRRLIQSVLSLSSDGDTVVCQIGTDTVQLDSFRTLRETIWLNDEIIHAYMNCLANRDKTRSETLSCRRSHFFKSYFVTKLFRFGYNGVRRWSRNVPGGDIFSLDKVVFPVNLGGVHWVCIVAFMQKKEIEYHDSLGYRTNDEKENLLRNGEKYMKAILSYLENEHLRFKKRHMSDDHWVLLNRLDTPKQDNGNDCGVYTCMTADFRSLDLPQQYTSNEVRFCRNRMALTLLNNSDHSFGS